MDRKIIKEEAIKLRKLGKTYSEIEKEIGQNIPKSTLSYWCKKIPLTSDYRKMIRSLNVSNLNKARSMALAIKRVQREKYLKSITDRVSHLSDVIKSKDSAKIALAMLYLGEGSKTQKGSLVFGNSDPIIINLFLRLLRYCYDIDESRFRCTLQCRADQDIKKLERFWSNIVKIPLSQFYKARIDSRTIGKPSKKPDYKGVCRIDYFSAEIFIELMKIAEVIYKGS